MFVTDEQAADIYARACRRWYGPKAKSVAKSKVRALKAKGDYKGVSAWHQVVLALERVERDTVLCPVDSVIGASRRRGTVKSIPITMTVPTV
jgi:hypothetical protein